MNKSTNKSTKELTIKQLQALYEKIVLNMNEALWVGDKDEKTVYANPKFCDLVGYKLSEIIGKESYIFWDEKSKEIVRRENITKRKNKQRSSYEGNLVTKDGSLIPVRVNGTYLPDGGTIGIITDLREITEYNEKLKELERIINDSHAITILWRNTEDKPIEFISENINRFGYKPEDFYSGKISYLDIVHKDDLKRVLSESFEHDIEGDKEFIQEYRIVTKSGEIRWVNDHTFIRKNSSGIITFHEGIVLDITERKKAENKVFEMYRYLGIINRKVSILLNLNKRNKVDNKQEALDLITNSAFNISGATICLLYKFEKDKKVFTLISNAGNIPSNKIKSISSINYNHDSCTKSIVDKMIRVQGVTKANDIKELNINGFIRYFIMLPILKEKELIGLTFLGFTDRQNVTSQELDFFDLFTIQIAQMMIQVDKL